MDHSLYGYLNRQSTKVLEMVLDQYMNAEDSEWQQMTIKIILDILAKRKLEE